MKLYLFAATKSCILLFSIDLKIFFFNFSVDVLHTPATRMVPTKMAVLRQNSLMLVAFLVLIVLTFKLMSVSYHHNQQFQFEQKLDKESQEYHMTKADMEMLRLFSRENVRMFVDVMEKLSNFLNKSNPVVNIRMEMKTDEEERNQVGGNRRFEVVAEERKSPLPFKTGENGKISISLGRNLESKDYEDTEFNVKESSENQTKRNKDNFLISLNQDEKHLLYQTASYFANVCAKLNVTYMMYGGTLLGSWRHHDIIPWDDDIDLQVNIKDRDELYSALSLDSSQFQVISAGPRLKLFSRAGKKTSRYPWLWPYIDIHFYKENDTHIKDSSKEFARYVYEKSILFPTHERPLGPLNLSAPKDSYATLRKTYTGHKCETYSYSHKLEKLRKIRKNVVPCETFRDQVAFVHRKQAADGRGLQETLVLGDSVIQTVFVSEPEYAITDPYTLDLLH